MPLLMRSAAGKVLSVFDIMQRPKSGSPLALLRNVVLLRFNAAAEEEDS